MPGPPGQWRWRPHASRARELPLSAEGRGLQVAAEPEHGALSWLSGPSRSLHPEKPAPQAPATDLAWTRGRPGFAPIYAVPPGTHLKGVAGKPRPAGFSQRLTLPQGLQAHSPSCQFLHGQCSSAASGAHGLGFLPILLLSHEHRLLTCSSVISLGRK